MPEAVMDKTWTTQAGDTWVPLSQCVPPPQEMGKTGARCMWLVESFVQIPLLMWSQVS